MPAMFAVAKSAYTQKPLWAVVAEESGAYAVVRPDGSRNTDQERRLTRLYDLARKKPETPDAVIRLASINQSAVVFASPIEADTMEDALTQAVAALS